MKKIKVKQIKEVWSMRDNEYSVQTGHKSGENDWETGGQHLPLRIFYNKETGEYKLFSTLVVNERGAEGIIKSLTSKKNETK